MVVHDHLIANRASGADSSILATDISARVLAVAQAAAYTAGEMARGLTGAQTLRYFEKRDDAWTVIEPVRRLITFRRLNLLQPPAGLGTFDAIFCLQPADLRRNDDARRRVCDHLYSVLSAGGWLVLGSAENLYGIDNRFESLTLGETLLYRKSMG